MQAVPEAKNVIFETHLKKYRLEKPEVGWRFPLQHSRKREAEKKSYFAENQTAHNQYFFDENEILRNDYSNRAYVPKKRVQDLLLKETGSILQNMQ